MVESQVAKTKGDVLAKGSCPCIDPAMSRYPRIVDGPAVAQ